MLWWKGDFFFFFNAYKESLQGKTQPWREKTSALTLIQMLVRVRVVTQQGAVFTREMGKLRNKGRSRLWKSYFGEN